MTEQQREDIRKLREKGFGYKLIAKELGISANSVKSFCRRNELFEPNGQTTSAHCEQCGKELVHTFSGNRYLIIRTKFEEYLLEKSTI